jgi:hypothetical protein
MGDRNLFMNTGSLMVLLFLMNLNFLFWIIMHYISVRFFMLRSFRKIGIMASNSGKMRNPLQLLLIDVYIDIILASSMNFFAIYYTRDPWELWEFFSTPANFMCSFFTFAFFLLGIMAPVQLTAVIRRNRHDLNAPDVLEKYGPYYEEFKNSGLNPYFNVILMLRRLIMVAILMGFTNYPGIQGMLFLFTSLISLMILIGMKPYKNKYTNYMEIFNEVTIFINSFITLFFMFNTDQNEEQLLNAKKSFAWMVIFNIALNMVVNMAVVIYQSVMDIY